MMISCSQAYYILYENEDMPVIDILNRSMDMMEDFRVQAENELNYNVNKVESVEI